MDAIHEQTGAIGAFVHIKTMINKGRRAVKRGYQWREIAWPGFVKALRLLTYLTDLSRVQTR